jgi:hypothetical protein
MLDGFRIPAAVGEILGIAFIAIGITSGVASIVVMGAVITAAATLKIARDWNGENG